MKLHFMHYDFTLLKRLFSKCGTFIIVGGNKIPNEQGCDTGNGEFLPKMTEDHRKKGVRFLVKVEQ